MTKLRLAGWALIALLTGYLTLLVRGQSVKTARVARPAAAVPAALLGRWQSTTDALSEVEITPTRYIEKYEGKPVSSASYQVSTACGCADAKRIVYKKPVILTVRNPRDRDCSCYIIGQVSATTLLLSNYGQGGQLSFRRAD